MDVLELFLALTSQVHQYGSEDQMRRFLPLGVQQDEIGNYYHKIGESSSMFAAHLDTLAYCQVEDVKHVIEDDDGRIRVRTDGNTILGADDRSGVLVLLYMIEKQIPGLYYFFIGEEVGRIGSQGISDIKPEYFKNYQRCVSFDRRGEGSIVSKQRQEISCSNSFVASLSNELMNVTDIEFFNDPNGVCTDSFSFLGLIPECTNISVGYYNAHSRKEYQDINYLKELCRGVSEVNWEGLPAEAHS